MEKKADWNGHNMNQILYWLNGWISQRKFYVQVVTMVID